MKFASKVLGILPGIAAMVLGGWSLVNHVTLTSVILSIAAIIIGMICIARKVRLRGFAIAGIVLAVINFSTYAFAYESLNRSVQNSQAAFVQQESRETAAQPSSGNTVRTTTSAGTESKTEASMVDPDLKAFLDRYEDFVDEYVRFMQSYYANPTDLSLLSKYADIMKKYADFEEKINAYDSKNMSTADASYYLEVTTRCTQKMLKVLETTGK